LRISCSDIAAVTGFNPWSKIDELFEKYLYQDLDELMVSDAECLDTEFLTTEQEIQKILQKIDSKDKEQFEAIDAVTKDSTVLNNNVKAEDMLKQIHQLMKDSGIVNKISTSELKFMENEFKGRVRKNYGVHCENASLDKYEQVMGFAVTDRNMETLKMKVMPEVTPTNGLRTKSSSLSALDATTEADHHPPVDAFAVLINGSKRLSKEAALAAQTGVKKRRTHDKPSFVLIGRVDGISRQLDMTSEDASQWGENKVVVEMKSRVRGISSPPPLYEQIQLVAYMIMLECSCGDLVQAVAKKEEKRIATSGGGKSEVEVVCLKDGLCMTRGSENKFFSVENVSGAECSVSNVSSSGSTSNDLPSAECVAHEENVSMCTTSDDCTPESIVSTQSSTNACSYLAETVSSAVSSSGSSGVNCSTVICKATTTTAQTNNTVIATTKTNTTVSTIQRASTTACISSTRGISTSTTSTTTIKTESTYQSKPRRHDPSVLYSDEEFQVNRIQLDGPPYYHRKYWDNVVMPRLRLFRDAVAVMRNDDSVRYAYLMSGPEEKVKMLQTFCPYFDV